MGDELASASAGRASTAQAKRLRQYASRKDSTMPGFAPNERELRADGRRAGQTAARMTDDPSLDD